MLTRRSFFILGGPVALAAALFGPAGLRGALAHHGWRWAADGNFELTGIIETVQLGNPHGVLTVDAEGEVWTRSEERREGKEGGSTGSYRWSSDPYKKKKK